MSGGAPLQTARGQPRRAKAVTMMVMGRRWILFLGSLVLLCLGCNGDETIATGAGGGSSGSGSSTGDVVEELCESVLDPATFTAPVWSPPPFVGTPECPALDGPIVVEISGVPVEGTVRVAGVPTQVELVRFVGRGDEGEAGMLVEDDGTFSLSVLPGRYDVWVSSAPGALIELERLAIEDLDLRQTGEPLLIDVPPLVTMQGLMTLDGEPAPDPVAHLFIAEAGGRGSLLARMDTGTYSAQLAPGTYRVGYTSCEPDWESMLHVGENPCYDPEVVLSPPFESPSQGGVSVTGDVVVDEDVQLDVDVPTVRLTGSVTVTGLPADDPGSLFLTTEDGGGGQIFEPYDALDKRVVEGTYQLAVRGGLPLIDKLELHADTHVDESIEAFQVNFAVAPDRPDIDVPYVAGPRVIVTAPDGAGIWDEHLPLAASLALLPNDYSVRHLTKYCWPDLVGDPPFVTRDIYDALTVEKLDGRGAADACARADRGGVCGARGAPRRPLRDQCRRVSEVRVPPRGVIVRGPRCGAGGSVPDPRRAR